eukprot:CAMPEP_0201511218 /NCGR_PEP_ID=MMETSP0161_2-20130828/3696_1 /ASSEMBLY_ACC=CAM_ASM_000251 /TAXON_ID=180227 /ORGANISM="Neoparamoeba aestuarina, Strain SoJaBio B1-5/56/2" /LENGTH=547 /DNA_ID=CAMNT_0047906615 /DNA_START=132 /DNA_END=1775 /DNA_ORIENTATION=+
MSNELGPKEKEKEGEEQGVSTDSLGIKLAYFQLDEGGEERVPKAMVIPQRPLEGTKSTKEMSSSFYKRLLKDFARDSEAEFTLHLIGSQGKPLQEGKALVSHLEPWHLEEKGIYEITFLDTEGDFEAEIPAHSQSDQSKFSYAINKILFRNFTGKTKRSNYLEVVVDVSWTREVGIDSKWTCFFELGQHIFSAPLSMSIDDYSPSSRNSTAIVQKASGTTKSVGANVGGGMGGPDVSVSSLYSRHNSQMSIVDHKHYKIEISSHSSENPCLRWCIKHDESVQKQPLTHLRKTFQVVWKLDENKPLGTQKFACRVGFFGTQKKLNKIGSSSGEKKDVPFFHLLAFGCKIDSGIFKFDYQLQEGQEENKKGMVYDEYFSPDEKVHVVMHKKHRVRDALKKDILVHVNKNGYYTSESDSTFEVTKIEFDVADETVTFFMKDDQGKEGEKLCCKFKKYSLPFARRIGLIRQGDLPNIFLRRSLSPSDSILSAELQLFYGLFSPGNVQEARDRAAQFADNLDNTRDFANYASSKHKIYSKIGHAPRFFEEDE